MNSTTGEDKPIGGFPPGQKTADLLPAVFAGFFAVTLIDIVRLPVRLHLFKLHPNSKGE